MFDRITFDPTIMGGRACIRGMRNLLFFVGRPGANGMTVNEIIEEYSDLEADDIRQALQDAARLTREEVHPVAGSAS